MNPRQRKEERAIRLLREGIEASERADAEIVDRHQQHSEELRTMAEESRSEAARQAWTTLAQDYDHLARQHQQKANVKRALTRINGERPNLLPRKSG